VFDLIPKLHECTPRSVYFIFALETVQTALNGADVYYWFISGYGQVDSFQHPHYITIDLPILGSISSLIVQCYFCYRIWTLSRNLWLCLVIIVVCVPFHPHVLQVFDVFLNSHRWLHQSG